jgi:hypothetical protein
VFVEGSLDCGHPLGSDFNIVVRKRHDGRVSRTYTGVARMRQALPRLEHILQIAEPAEPGLDEFARAVGGVVIHQDDVEPDTARLPFQRCQGKLQLRRPVEGTKND